MVVNETAFYWDENTVFNNAKGIPVPVENSKSKPGFMLKVKMIKPTESVCQKGLPPSKYIERKERHLYPFIQNQ